MMVITEERASDILFTASNVIAIEFEITPIIALKTASMTFVPTPIILVLIIALSLF